MIKIWKRYQGYAFISNICLNKNLMILYKAWLSSDNIVLIYRHAKCKGAPLNSKSLKHKIWTTYIDQVKHLKWKNLLRIITKYAKNLIESGFWCDSSPIWTKTLQGFSFLSHIEQ
jgi:hypothetical protein